MHICMCMYIGAFYYLLGNLRPQRSKINNIQLLLLGKYIHIAEFGIDHIMKPIIEDIKKLEPVSYYAHSLYT